MFVSSSGYYYTSMFLIVQFNDETGTVSGLSTVSIIQSSFIHSIYFYTRIPEINTRVIP